MTGAAAQAVQAQQLQRLLSLDSTNKVWTGNFLCTTLSGVDHNNGVTIPMTGGDRGYKLDGMITYLCGPATVVEIELASARGLQVQPLPPGASCTPMPNRQGDVHICAPTFLEAVNRQSNVLALDTVRSVHSMGTALTRLSSTVHAIQQTMNGGAMGPA